MVGLTLLQEARRAGLRVRTEGGRLIVRGPRSQEALARRLLAHKAEVLAALRGEARPAPEAPRLPQGVRFADVSPEEQGREAVRRLDAQGWVALWVFAAEAVALVAHDPETVPGHLRARFPVFTGAEVGALVPAGPETIRAAYRRKLAALKEMAARA